MNQDRAAESIVRRSELVQAATGAERPTRWWLAYIVSVACFVVPGSIIIPGMDAILDYGDGSATAQIVEGVAWLVTFVLLVMWVAYKERRPGRTIGFIGPGGLQRFGLGLLIGALMMAAVTLLTIAFGQYERVDAPEGVTSGASALIPVILLLGVWIIQGSTEETANRGYQLQVGALQLPGWLAVALPGLLFMSLHLGNEGGFQPLVLINLVLFALFATFIALGQGSLWLVCGIHAAWNWAQGNVLGLDVSGNPTKENSIVSLAQTSNATDLLSGGDFGPEGSIISTTVWGVAALLAFVYMRRELAAKADVTVDQAAQAELAQTGS